MKIKTALLFLMIFGWYASTHAQLSITISTPDTSVCDNQSVTLTANITGCTNSYTLNWTDGFQLAYTCSNPCSTWTNIFTSGTHAIYAQLFCNLQGNAGSNTINLVVDPCSGVDELEGNSPTTVYPNPSSETITIDFTSAGNSDYTLSIFDRSGKKVDVNYEMKKNTLFFSTKHFAQGIYYYRLTDEKEKKYAAGKFVIAK